MFGFFRPGGRLVRWRQSYARICQTQRRLFGLTSLPFLSYEATLLYQLAIDFGLIPLLPESAPQCCRLGGLRNAGQQQDAGGAEFAAIPCLNDGAEGMHVIETTVRNELSGWI